MNFNEKLEAISREYGGRMDKMIRQAVKVFGHDQELISCLEPHIKLIRADLDVSSRFAKLHNFAPFAACSDEHVINMIESLFNTYDYVEFKGLTGYNYTSLSLNTEEDEFYNKKSGEFSQQHLFSIDLNCKFGGISYGVSLVIYAGQFKINGKSRYISEIQEFVCDELESTINNKFFNSKNYKIDQFINMCRGMPQ